MSHADAFLELELELELELPVINVIIFSPIFLLFHVCYMVQSNHQTE